MWAPSISALSASSIFFPISYYLFKKNHFGLSKFLFIFTGNLHIYLVSLFLGHNVWAEYFYFVALIIPVLIYDYGDKKNIAISTFVPMFFWLATKFVPISIVPENLLVKNMPIEPIRFLNFVLAFILCNILIVVFSNTVKLLSDNIKASLDLERVVNKIYDISEMDISFHDKLDQVLEVLFSFEFLSIKKQGAFLLINSKNNKYLNIEYSKNVVLNQNISPDNILLDSSLCGRSIRDRKIIYANHLDTSHEPLFKMDSEFGQYLVPLVLNDEILGLIVLNLDYGHLKSSIEVHALEFLSRPISELIKKSQVNDQLEIETRKMNHYSKLASIGELAAGVGHEINNPLSIIMGYVNSAKRNLESDNFNKEKVISYLDKSKIAGDRIGKIVQGLRTFSRSDESNISEFNFNEALMESIGLVEDIYIKEGVLIKYDESIRHAKHWMMGNRGRLQQVIMNLLSNAKDATEGNPKRIIEVKLQISNKIILYVKDNGHGIADDIKEKIMEPFFTTKGIHKGTGLGLSLVHTIVKEHDGELELTSSVNEGTCFKLSFPKIEVQEVLEEKEDRVLDTPCNLKIAVVDDEEEIRTLMTLILERFGYQVKCYENGKEAYEAYLEKPDEIDLIITDVQMPIMTGQELVLKIRKNHEIPQPKLIIFTGGTNVDFETENSEVNSAIDGYFFKPFNSKIIKDVIFRVTNT